MLLSKINIALSIIVLLFVLLLFFQAELIVRKNPELAMLLSENGEEKFVYSPNDISKILQSKNKNISFKEYKKMFNTVDVSDYFKLREVFNKCNNDDECKLQLSQIN